MSIAGGVALAVCLTGYLIFLIVGDAGSPLRICAPGNPSQLIVVDFQQVAVCTCAGIDPVVRIIREVEYTHVGDFLVHDSSLGIIHVLDIHLAL